MKSQSLSCLLLLLLQFTGTSSSFLSWMKPFGGSTSSEKYVRKRDLKSISWTSESVLDGSEGHHSTWSWWWWWSSSDHEFTGLFMKCIPLKPDRVCPLTLNSASCKRDSEEEPWSCMGSHEDIGAQGKSLEIQINYLGVDCPDQREDSVNPSSCILRYSLFREPVGSSSGPLSFSSGRSYVKEFLLFLFLLLVAIVCIYLLRQNLMRKRISRRLTNLRDLLAVSEKPKAFKRSRSSSDLRPYWSLGSEYGLTEPKSEQEEEDDSLITFPGSPHVDGAPELSLLNQERRLENVYPTHRRRIRRSKSQNRLVK